jgi:hypothetical protein
MGGIFFYVIYHDLMVFRRIIIMFNSVPDSYWSDQ